MTETTAQFHKRRHQSFQLPTGPSCPGGETLGTELRVPTGTGFRGWRGGKLTAAGKRACGRPSASGHLVPGQQGKGSLGCLQGTGLCSGALCLL